MEIYYVRFRLFQNTNLLFQSKFLKYSSLASYQMNKFSSHFNLNFTEKKIKRRHFIFWKIQMHLMIYYHNYFFCLITFLKHNNHENTSTRWKYVDCTDRNSDYSKIYFLSKLQNHLHLNTTSRYFYLIYRKWSKIFYFIFFKKKIKNISGNSSVFLFL